MSEGLQESDVSLWDCIAERERTQGGGVVREVWHIVAGPPNEEVTWQPIMCGEGIVFPGNTIRREATCDACVMAAIQARL